MKSKTVLPEGYYEYFSVNLQTDKKMAILINVAALVIALAMAIPMHFYIPFSSLFNMSDGFAAYFLRFAVLIVGTVAYIILHELVHAVTMKCFGTKRVKFGFTGLYAFAGSDDYYPKAAYIIIALAPVVLWGIVIGIVNALVPYEWFWVVYFIQIINISGAAGDLYVTFKFCRMPEDILVHDIGVGMTVYSQTVKF